jgi:hypothetical protein
MYYVVGRQAVYVFKGGRGASLGKALARDALLWSVSMFHFTFKARADIPSKVNFTKR